MKLDEISSILSGDTIPSQVSAPDEDNPKVYKRMTANQAKRNEISGLSKMKAPIRATDLRKSLNANRNQENEKIEKIIDNLQYCLGLSAGTSVQSIVEQKINELLKMINNKQK